MTVGSTVCCASSNATRLNGIEHVTWIGDGPHGFSVPPLAGRRYFPWNTTGSLRLGHSPCTRRSDRTALKTFTSGGRKAQAKGVEDGTRNSGKRVACYP